MQVGKKYRILSVIVEDDATAKPKKIYMPAILLKIFPSFYLFQTKHYKTTVHKQDFRFIKEV